MTQLVNTPATQRVSPTAEKSSPSAYGDLDGVPDGDAAAATLLTRAAAAVRRNQEVERVSRQLARFLGAASHVWTYARKAELRAILRDAKWEGALAALWAVADRPHPEVIDEAARLLEAMAREQPLTIASLLDWPPIAKPELQALATYPAVRVVAARALANVASSAVFESLLKALPDPSTEVRDAVVEVLAMRGDPAAVPALRARFSVEPAAVVRASIAEAIEELGADR